MPQNSDSSTKQDIVFFSVFLTIDVLLLVLLFAPSGLFYLKAQPFYRGFYCDDESLAYPYKNDSVTIATVGVVGTIMPLIGIVVVEALYYLQLHKKYQEQARDLNPVDIGGKELPALVHNILSSAGYFGMGLAVTLLFTEMSKCIVGRLRPHFLNLCKPDFTKIKCFKMQEDGIDKLSLYVENFTCTNTHRKLLDSRKSFPSGHSSMAIYCMLFLTLYLQYRIHWKGMHFLKVFCQTICMLLAVSCCLSRISDYKHHWSDVLAGAVLGIVVTYQTFYLLWKLPRRYYELER